MANTSFPGDQERTNKELAERVRRTARRLVFIAFQQMDKDDCYGDATVMDIVECAASNAWQIEKSLSEWCDIHTTDLFNEFIGSKK